MKSNMKEFSTISIAPSNHTPPPLEPFQEGWSSLFNTFPDELAFELISFRLFLAILNFL